MQICREGERAISKLLLSAQSARGCQLTRSEVAALVAAYAMLLARGGSSIEELAQPQPETETCKTRPNPRR